MLFVYIKIAMAKKKNSGNPKDLSRKLEQMRLRKEPEHLLDDPRTPLARRIARNVDQLLIVASIREPDFVYGLVDRFLLLSSIEELKPVICISKTDLDPDRKEVNRWRKQYQSLGFEVITSSVVNSDGMESVYKALSGKRTALAGHSGVGKSSLLNAINPNLEIQTAPVSLRTGKGIHVTKRVKLLRINENTEAFDLPGIRLIDFPDLTPVDIAMAFPDFLGYIEECKFKNCTHVPEPGCAVKAAVEKGSILQNRYESYVKIIEELAR